MGGEGQHLVGEDYQVGRRHERGGGNSGGAATGSTARAYWGHHGDSKREIQTAGPGPRVAVGARLGSDAGLCGKELRAEWIARVGAQVQAAWAWASTK